MARDSSKMLEIPMTTLCHNQVGHNLNLDRCKNLKPRKLNTHTKLDSAALQYGIITVGAVYYTKSTN